MNRIELKRRLEELEELLAQGKYSAVAKKCDELNLEQITNLRLLQEIAKAYEKCRRYVDAEDVLLHARSIAPKSRSILFHLCNAATKAGDLEEAKEFYQDFAKLDPKASEAYILQYRIGTKMEQPNAVLIQILENMKEEEADDHFMFILAQLYAKEKNYQKAISVCEEIALWFNSGKYTRMAAELREQLEDYIENPVRYSYPAPVIKEDEGSEEAEETVGVYSAAPRKEPEEEPGEDLSEFEEDERSFHEIAHEVGLLQRSSKRAEMKKAEETKKAEELKKTERGSFTEDDIPEEPYPVPAEKNTARTKVPEYDGKIWQPAEDMVEADTDPGDNDLPPEIDFDESLYLTEDMELEASPEEAAEKALKSEADTDEAEPHKTETVSSETKAETFEFETDSFDTEAAEGETDTESVPDETESDYDLSEEEYEPLSEESEEPEDEVSEIPEVVLRGRTNRPILPEIDDEKVAGHFRALFGEDNDEPIMTIRAGETAPDEELVIGAPEEQKTEERSTEVPEQPAVKSREERALPEEDPTAEHVVLTVSAAENLVSVLKAERALQEEVPARPSENMEMDSYRVDSRRKDLLPRVDYDSEEVGKLNYILDRDSSSFLEQIARRKDGEELFGKLPVNPEISNRIWHYLVFGETEELTLECALEKLKEIGRVNRNCPKKVLKTSAVKIQNASIVNSLDRFLGNAVVVQDAGDLSNEQLRDFAKVLDQDDRSLLIVLTDTKRQIAELFRRVPALADSFSAVFEGKRYSAKDLVAAASDVLFAKEARMTEDASMFVLGEAQRLLRNNSAAALAQIESLAEAALDKAEKGGFMGLGGGRLDKDNYLIVDEKHFRKALREKETDAENAASGYSEEEGEL